MTATPRRWPEEDEDKPAPAPLDRVQLLVNTLDRETGLDRLAAADDARPWLENHGLLAESADIGPEDLDVVRAVRESLRALLVHNAGGPAPGPADVAPLRAVASAGSAEVVLGDDGEIGLAPAGDSLRERLAGLLLVIRDAQRDGTWARLKACANDDCQWAFYDQSRNRGGSWCTMAACGNRLKNRDFRARHRGG